MATTASTATASTARPAAHAVPMLIGWGCPKPGTGPIPPNCPTCDPNGSRACP